MAVGSSASGRAGSPATGDVRLFRFDRGRGALAARPDVVFSGETVMQGSEFGASIAAGTSGGTPVLAIGAPWANSLAVDQGAAFSAAID